MGLLQQGITVLNFDDSLVPQDRLRSYTQEWIDLAGLSGTRRFCERMALEQIRQRLGGRTGKGITLLGSGDFHYVSYLLLSEQTRPFSLILFDNHSDMMETAGVFASLFSCGSWACRALRLENLRKAVVIGANPQTFRQVPPSLLQKVVYLPYAKPVQPLPSGLQVLPSVSSQGIEKAMGLVLGFLPTDAIYISIDKDVLTPLEVMTNWDQGQMCLQELLDALRCLVENRQVLGADICGELPWEPQVMMGARRRAFIGRNQEANLRILHTLLPNVS